MNEKKAYTAWVMVKKPCAGPHDGMGPAFDCGCMWDETVGKSDNLPAAKMMAAKAAKKATFRGHSTVGACSVSNEIGDIIWSL